MGIGGGESRSIELYIHRALESAVAEAAVYIVGYSDETADGAPRYTH